MRAEIATARLATHCTIITTLTLTLTRSDAFDALHLEYTVHLLTTWRKVRVRVGVRVRVKVRVRVRVFVRVP